MNAENEKEELLEEETADEMPEETAEPAEDAAEGDEDSEVSAEVSTEEAVEAERERYLRLYAEFDNFRKRTAREKTEVYGDATARCIEQLLPVVDNFERAMEAPCSDAQYQSGMEMIFGQMKNFLEKLGVTEVESLGAEFDPNVHNAIKQGEATEEYPEGTVCEVFQKGYKLNDKLIRPAMVAVAG
ncbi:MAG: nucleotide exchange factor GrpE [Oscillospiraceae bacterium]|nr:nucleotide exchange factor GrpE [Oscillospiraceae bacterium]